MESIQMEHLALTKTNKITNVISKLLYKTQALSALVIQNNGEIEDFDRVASTIIDDPSIRNVIIAPNGIVSHIYPLEGNEKAIGLNYFSEGAGNKEAIYARDSEQLVLGGPFDLIQGGQAMVGRLPVYLGEKKEEKQFWGLVSVTLNYPQALEGAELEQLKNQGFAYEIWRISPDTNEKQIIASSNYSYNKNAQYIELPISIFNAEWYFRLSPIKSWYQYPETWIFSIIGFLISLLIAFLVLHNHDLKQMKLELEELTSCDPLTGALNRRGIFHQLDEMILKKEPFILCYLDLNRFKYINDTFGHNTGDKILQEFASLVKQHITAKHLLARIGGDEFILVFKNTNQTEEVTKFLDQIHSDLKQMKINHHHIPITFSAGKAVYPENGDTIDDLIGFADQVMYENKSK